MDTASRNNRHCHDLTLALTYIRLVQSDTLSPNLHSKLGEIIGSLDGIIDELRSRPGFGSVS
jgi:hypothetical protein